MFCNFCGKNFDASEGFEEATRAGHHMIRCEKCVYNQSEEEYDWRTCMYGRGHTTLQSSYERDGPNQKNPDCG